MRISASRLAAVIAARLGPVVPPPFRVRAVGPELRVEHPHGPWGFSIPLDWIEGPGERRSAAELAELMVGNVLNHVQDEVSEALREPWPPLSPPGPPRTMAPYGTRCDGADVYFWYGRAEQAPVIAFAPIALSEVLQPG